LRKDDIHFLLRNPHVQTIWGSRFRRVNLVDYHQEKVELDDGDFLNIFWGPKRKGPVVCLFHGLEGSVESKHILGLMKRLAECDFQSVVMHHRSCGGEINRLAKAYHSGMTEDLVRLFSVVQQRYPDRKCAAIGYSLGGNMVLKYAIDFRKDCSLSAVVSISPPIDLVSCTDRIDQGLSKLYLRVFLRSLHEKSKQKRQLLEGQGIDVDQALSVPNFWHFDEHVTAPLHGFTGALDYYTKCSTKSKLKEICVPHLLLTSTDDPLLGKDCVPDVRDVNSLCTLCVTEYGGHVGFVSGSPRKPYYWGEVKVVEWLVNVFYAG
jgi:uncharacterized protein